MADLHTHTLMSGHAYSTIDELVRAAKDRGLDAIAVTDHGPNMPCLHPAWYFENMKALPPFAHGIELFRGIEANIIDDNGVLDATDDTMKNLNFVIASCHTVTISGDSPAYYTHACTRAMRNPKVNVIGHPDDSRMPVLYPALVKAAAETNTLLELNNHSLSHHKPRLNAAENCMELLRECRRQGVQVVVSSDAHICYQVGHFENALELLREIDFPEELVANTSVKKLKSLLKLKGWRD
jgi:putative hydrolase